jgi:hypothetical protein
MAKTQIQKSMTDVVENFIGLWNRYYTLYLEGTSQQDITSEKENEFLKFQGTMVEQLVNLLELDPKPRFDVHDKVMAVIHDVVSLDLYTKMSEFQVNRAKQQWQEAMDELNKLYRFCETYDPKIDKVQKITEVRRKNPFWDPTHGGMRDVVSRLAVAPVTFFQGLKTGVAAEKINRFIFLTLLIPTVIVLTIVFMANFETVKIIGRNVCIEAGLLSSDETGFIPGLIIAAVVFAGLLLISLLFSAVLLLLHYLFAVFMHAGFKITGAKNDYRETYKAVAYGTTPIVAVVTTPYAIVLQVIGASKVHKYPYALAAIGWIVGVVLFTAVLLAGAGAAFYFTGNVPPVGEYVYVLEDDTSLMDRRFDPEHTVNEGDWLLLSELEEKNITVRKEGKVKTYEVYEVEYDDEDYYVEYDSVEIREFSWGGMPAYVFERMRLSVHQARRFLNRVIEKYSE